jgi:hypothetical protein
VSADIEIVTVSRVKVVQHVANMGLGVDVVLNVGHDIGDYARDLGCQNAMTTSCMVGKNGDGDV